MLGDLKSYFDNYDLKFYNQESILGGLKLGLSNYHRFNSPYEVGETFPDLGVDLIKDNNTNRTTLSNTKTELFYTYY